MSAKSCKVTYVVQSSDTSFLIYIVIEKGFNLCVQSAIQNVQNLFNMLTIMPPDTVYEYMKQYFFLQNSINNNILQL